MEVITNLNYIIILNICIILQITWHNFRIYLVIKKLLNVFHLTPDAHILIQIL